MSWLIYGSIPAFIVLMVLEGLWAWRAAEGGRRLRGYEARDTAASLTMGIGNVLISAVTKVGMLAVWTYLWKFRIFTIPEGVWWSWALLFVAEDFCYYWFHRAHHEVRLFWAAHVNHHSSTHYNLSTALRQSWTTPITGPVFWVPLVLLGFPPWMILTQQAISLLYQFWLHTEAIGRLGPLEWVLNTPSHHRVHHGRNVEYLDQNHGGILIVWDRLFGSFTPERGAVDYGLTTNISTHHPVTIAFHEWGAMVRDVKGARSLREAVGFVLGPPGWSPDGSRRTSRQMRAEEGSSLLAQLK
ncbi:MAG: sterol desaturase family protein [Polyangiaceae bacterium]|jgi:sterol desaturase/sphingolipid hydroxylase (fatty acid hydroxylase superfamily)|nr:sterol desaturase family protein [Polyangiaceae bacterium]